MGSELALTKKAGELALAGDLDAAEAYASRSREPSTKRAYAADWRAWTAWAASRGVAPLGADPALVAAFLAAEANDGRKPSTIQRRAAAIATYHRAAGLDSPSSNEAVRSTLRGIRRTLGTAPAKKDAITPGELRAILPTGTTLGDLRDRALLLVGFASGLRRSELVSLDATDLEFLPLGVLATVRRSKTDQEGAGRLVEVEAVNGDACPVLALRRWLDAASIASGPIFRHVTREGVVKDRLTAQSVALIVKRRATSAGIDPDRYGGHSLRSGLATALAGAGLPEHEVQQATGHRSVTVLRGYIRRGQAFSTKRASLVLGD